MAKVLQDNRYNWKDRTDLSVYLESWRMGPAGLDLNSRGWVKECSWELVSKMSTGKTDQTTLRTFT